MSIPNEDELLERARAGMTPSREDKAQMRSRLLTSVAAVGAGAGVAGTAATGAASVGLGTKVLVLALGVSVASAVGYATFSAPAEEVEVASAPDVPSGLRRRPRAAHAPAPRPMAEPEPTEELVPDPEQEPVAEREPPASAPLEQASSGAAPSGAGAAPPSARAARAPRPVPAAAAPADSLREESALIARARAALRQGDAAAALRALAAHRARFPEGFLSEERDVQQVRALCARGDRAAAEAAARRFGAEHPGSLHLDALADPCAER